MRRPSRQLAERRFVVGARLSASIEPGSLGIVTQTTFVRCYWPTLDEPAELFAEGSAGIEVMGPPTPRNVVFPADTVFVDYLPDAQSAAEIALRTAFPGRHLVELTPAEVDLYMRAYRQYEATAPSHAARVATRPDCYLLGRRINIAAEGEKPVLERWISEITAAEALALCRGQMTRADLDVGRTYERLRVR